MTIPIVDLGPICAEQAARNRQLFELLGSWVTSTTDPELQRLFATGCHRHAWHAELWEARTPLIAGTRFDTALAIGAVDVAGDEARRAWYRQQLVELDESLASLAAACDTELDPSTARTVQLVAADIADLQLRVVN